MVTIGRWWLKRSRAQKKWLILLVLIVAGYGFYQLWQLRYHPWRNSHPKYFVTIKGHVDPQIAGIVKLKWIAVYGSSTPECDATYNWIEGIIGARIKTSYFVPKIDSSGDYEVRIPIDYYRPGYCQWQIYSIDDASDVYQSRSDDNAEIFILFYPCGRSGICGLSELYPKTKREEQYKITGKANDIYKFDNKNTLKFVDVKDSDIFNNDAQENAVPRTANYTFTENHILER